MNDRSELLVKFRKEFAYLHSLWIDMNTMHELFRDPGEYLRSRMLAARTLLNILIPDALAVLSRTPHDQVLTPKSMRAVRDMKVEIANLLESKNTPPVGTNERALYEWKRARTLLDSHGMDEISKALQRAVDHAAYRTSIQDVNELL